MFELLKEQLAEYQTHYNLLEMTCVELMGKGEPFEKYAKEAAGYKIMIESTKEYLKLYESVDQL